MQDKTGTILGKKVTAIVSDKRPLAQEAIEIIGEDSEFLMITPNAEGSFSYYVGKDVTDERVVQMLEEILEEVKELIDRDGKIEWETIENYE